MAIGVAGVSGAGWEVLGTRVCCADGRVVRGAVVAL